MLRKKQGRETKGGFLFFQINKVSKKGLIEKVTFEQRLQGGEEVSQPGLWGRTFQPEGTVRAKAWSWSVPGMVEEEGEASAAGGE